VSATYGSPRTHIWIYAAGLSEQLLVNNQVYSCLCAVAGSAYTPQIPPSLILLEITTVTVTFVLVQQPAVVGQGAIYPPTYNTTFGAPTVPVTGDPGANYNYGNQPGYPLATGTGDQYAQKPAALSYGQKPGIPSCSIILMKLMKLEP
jgi:hypothetical protein